MRRLAVLVASLLALPVSTAAWAEYPERPVRMIVPFPAGGVTDVVARLTAERLSAEFGQPVIVDNKAGAGGMIGTEVVAKAAPDGYTVLFTTPNHTINAALRATVPYDAEKDLAPISIVGQIPMLLVSHPTLPVTDLPSFVDYAQEPGQDQRLPCRQRHAAARHDGAADGQGAHAGHQRALSRRGAGAGRSGGRPGAGQARHLHDRRAARCRQEAERARRHRVEAPETAAQRADRHGKRRAGRRGLPLDGHRGARRHAAAHPRQARRSDQTNGRGGPTSRPVSTRTPSSRSAIHPPSSRLRSAGRLRDGEISQSRPTSRWNEHAAEVASGLA